MTKRLLKTTTTALFLVVAALSLVWLYIAQPTTRHAERSALRVDTSRLRETVVNLSTASKPRNYLETANLEACARFIAKHFKQAGAEVQLQPFTINSTTYLNVIGRFGKGRGGKIIVGAHYDAATGTPGADDNASGVAGLIELAYLLGRNPQDKNIELVAYNLEEPPFFGSDRMGSAFHATHLGSTDKIAGVIVLEMIGYYNDGPETQSYPVPLLRLYYPSRGNFVVVAGRLDQRAFARRVKIGMAGTTDLPVYSINAPAGLPGIDFSDHRNYWPLGINAVMITDTAFYRNKAYHEPEDTPDKLDYDRLGKVIVGVYEAVKSL